MGLILNDLKNACELEHVCDYVNNRTTSSMNYISTENMLPNKGGISESTIIPPGTTTEYKIGDILISNIRPYFQKYGVLIGAVGALRMFCVFVQKKIQIANIYTIC